MAGTGAKSSLGSGQGLSDPDLRRSEVLRRIRTLQKQIRFSVGWMALFFLVSLGAVLNFRFLPPITEKMRHLLGISPPTTLISIALVVYVFSALTLILGRMNTGPERYRGWSHIGYLSAFYLFYYYADGLRENFWPVFFAGLTILSLENYRVWSVCSEAIKREKEILAQLEK